MNGLSEITLGDLARGLRRYQPFLAVVAAIVLIAVFLPGHAVNPTNDNSALNTGNGLGVNATPGQTPTGATAGVPGPNGQVTGPPPGAVGAAVGGSTSGGTVLPPAGNFTGTAGSAVDPNCDTVTR